MLHSDLSVLEDTCSTPENKTLSKEYFLKGKVNFFNNNTIQRSIEDINHKPKDTNSMTVK